MGQQYKRLSGRRNKVSGLAAEYQEAGQQLGMFSNLYDWMIYGVVAMGLAAEFCGLR